MADQAESLRRLLERNTPRLPHKARRIAFLSGKGGVGKTNLAVNCALVLSRMGRKTILIDCDLGLANADFLLGIHPKTTLDNILLAGKEVKSAVIVTSSGLSVVPGAGAIIPRQAVSGGKLETVLISLDNEAEFIIMDAGAGIDEGVQYVARVSDEVVVVALPESAAAINAYRLIKILHEQNPHLALRLIINKSPSHNSAFRTASGIMKAGRDFLNLEVEYLGWIPDDSTVEQAARERRPFVEKYPASDASRAVIALINRLIQPPATPLSAA